MCRQHDIARSATPPDAPGLEKQIAAQEPRIEYPRLELGEHPKNGDAIAVRVGRYGPYLQQGAGDERVVASIPEGVAPAELTVEDAVALLKKAARGNWPQDRQRLCLAGSRRTVNRGL